MRLRECRRETSGQHPGTRRAPDLIRVAADIGGTAGTARYFHCDIAREADRLGLDAGMSWSCYDPTDDGRHCGACDSCRLRARGFAEAGLIDPTVYAASYLP